MSRRWYVVDGSGRRIDYEPEHFDAYGPLTSPGEQPEREATGPVIPLDAMPGKAKWIATLAWDCNPLQRALGWSIVLVQAPVEFQIVRRRPLPCRRKRPAALRGWRGALCISAALGAFGIVLARCCPTDLGSSSYRLADLVVGNDLDRGRARHTPLLKLGSAFTHPAHAAADFFEVRSCMKAFLPAATWRTARK